MSLESAMGALLQAGPLGIVLALMVFGQLFPKSTVDAYRERAERSEEREKRATDIAEESLQLQRENARRRGSA
jgi:hypothetical protein